MASQRWDVFSTQCTVVSIRVTMIARFHLRWQNRQHHFTDSVH